MKSIKTTPEFMNLEENEIIEALDAFENLFSDDDDVDPSIEPENPIVSEVARLINEYTNRFDELLANNEDGELPEEIFEYEPEIIIERVAYEIFMDAVHDSMQDADEYE